MKQRPSFIFRLTTALFLSSLYYVFAIGIWAVSQDKLGVGADVTTTNTVNLTAIPTWNGIGTTQTYWQQLDAAAQISARGYTYTTDFGRPIALDGNVAPTSSGLYLPNFYLLPSLSSVNFATTAFTLCYQLTGVPTAQNIYINHEYAAGTNCPQGYIFEKVLGYMATSPTNGALALHRTQMTNGLNPAGTETNVCVAIPANGVDVCHGSDGRGYAGTDLGVIGYVWTNPTVTISTTTTSTPPTASLSGPTSGTIGDKLSFTATGKQGTQGLSKLELYWSPKVTANGWTQFASGTCSGANCTLTGAWDTTGLTSGDYYVVTAAYDTDAGTPGGQCTGNSVAGNDLWGNPQSSLWPDCGSTSRLTVSLPNQGTGVAYVCSANDPGKAVTDDFDLLSEGATSFGWRTTNWSNTSTTVKQAAGKSGNGVALVDANSGAGYQNQAQMDRPFRAGTDGSVSFDVRPKQTNARFQAGLFNNKVTGGVIGDTGGTGTSASDGALFYFAPDGTFQYWNYKLTGGYIRLGSSTYQANQWYTITMSWHANMTYDIAVNGQKINDQPLPFLYQNGTGPLDVVGFTTGWGGTDTGSFDVDNVTYPGCGGSPALTVQPTTGAAALTVTATGTPGSVSLLNQLTTELNDVDAPTDQHLTKSQDATTGAITITGTPTAPANSPKCWIYDLDQNRSNQLQWKQTIPDHAIVDAKISWNTPDVNGKGGLLQGGIGLIDKDSFFQNWVGFNDGSGTLNDFGILAAVTRDYQKISVACNATDATQMQKEWTVAEPAGQSFATTKTFSSPTGTASVRIVRDGPHAKLFVNGKQIKEMDMQGDVVGIALSASDFPGYPFTSLTLQSLTLANATLTWDFGDGSPKVTSSDTTIQHTYAKAGTYVLTLSNGSQSLSQTISVTTPAVVVTTSPTVTSSASASATATVQTTPTPSPSATVQKQTFTLVSTGGNLLINLIIATILSVLTTFLFLRRSAIEST